MDVPDIHILERATLLISLDLLVIGLFLAFLNSELGETLWENTNIVIKLMFAAGIAVSYLYILFPNMEDFVGWVNDTYWTSPSPEPVRPLTRPLPPQPGS